MGSDIAQRQKARAMFASGGAVKSKKMTMRAAPMIKAAPRMKAPMMAPPMPSAAPDMSGMQMPGMKKGGKVKKMAMGGPMVMPPQPSRALPGASTVMKNGGKVKKMAVGGAAKVRLGEATPAGKPTKPSMPSAKEKMTMPKTKGK